jgi:hypothetical protein
MAVRGAGILFSQRGYVLLGQKSYGKLEGKWSGFGGSLNPGERPSHGAVREILEEVYGIHNEESLVQDVLQKMPLRASSYRKGYALYRLNFDHLNHISRLINQRQVKAPNYGGFTVPQNIEDLAASFQPPRGSEFSKLAFFLENEIKATGKVKGIDPEIVRDLGGA